ncbi:MAG: hypothetical protein V4610_11645 [Pseudomonadota bacterium]|jgi:hypothetical protein
MVILGVAVVFGIVFAGLAFRANARFRDEKRLPMQWWLTGEVTWSAPRVFALAFIPALAICVFAACVALNLNVPSRAGQEGMVLPTLIGMGALFVACQFLHLWLIDKTLRRNGS